MKKSSVGRGVIILSMSNIILKLLSALYMPILASILTDNGIATYIVSYKIFIFLFSITSLGVQPSITKLVAEQRANGSYKSALKVLKVSKKASLFYGGIVSILFAITSIPLSKIFNSEESILSFIFLSPAIVIAAVLSTYRGYFQGCNDMVSLSISNIIEQLLNVVFSLFFAFYFMKISISWGSAGGTIGTTIGAIGAILYIKYVLNKKNVHEKCSNIDYVHKIVLYDHEILKSLFVYSVPFILIIAIQNLGSIIDVATIRMFVKNNINIKTATLEYYTTIINVPLVIITSLGVAIFPKIIKSFIEKDKEELILQTAYCYKLIYIITIPSTCGLAILSKEIFKFVFNRSFGYEVLIFGSISLIFMALSTIQNIILQGINKFKFVITVNAIALFIKIIFNIILIKINNLEVMGIIISNIATLLIITVLNHIKLQKSLHIKIPIIKQSKYPIISSIIMSISLLLLRYTIINNLIIGNYTRLTVAIATLILIIMGGVIYLLSMIFFGGFNKYELDTISPLIYKKLPCILRKKIL